jgi:hypothetical protein
MPPAMELRIELRELLAALPPVPQEMPGDRPLEFGRGWKYTSVAHRATLALDLFENGPRGAW